MRYEWIDYDVWGNDDDGYTVNDTHRTGRYVELLADVTDADAIEALIAGGFLSEAARGSVTVDGEDGYSLYFTEPRNGYHLGELRVAGT